MHIYILTITNRAYFANQPLMYPRRYSNNHTHTKAPPVPLKADPNGKLMGALCGSEVDKMVDVNVPLTMN